MDRSGTIWTVSIIALSALILGVILFAAPKSASNVTDLSEPPAVTSDDWVRGRTDAPVTLIEYGDLQCPACAQYQPIVTRLVEEAPDRLRVVFRHFPLPKHADAELVARAAEAAGKQGQFFEMLDVLYAKQGEWANRPRAQSILEGYARELGLDADRWRQDLQADDVRERIERGKREAAGLRLNQTPTFFLNGQAIENPAGYEAFKALIEADIGRE